MPVDQVGLFLRGETVRKLLDDIGHEEVIDVNVADVWDKKIFDPLPLAAEHTAQIRDRVAVFGADQRKNFSCHRLCRAVLGDRRRKSASRSCEANKGGRAASRCRNAPSAYQ